MSGRQTKYGREPKIGNQIELDPIFLQNSSSSKG